MNVIDTKDTDQAQEGEIIRIVRIRIQKMTAVDVDVSMIASINILADMMTGKEIGREVVDIARAKEIGRDHLVGLPSLRKIQWREIDRGNVSGSGREEIDGLHHHVGASCSMHLVVYRTLVTLSYWYWYW